jgi:Rad3-related DNA helicase
VTPDWRPHFPFPDVRPEQAEALDWICDRFSQGEQVVIAECGTGIGKSAIAACLAGWIDGTGVAPELAPGGTVLTSQKVLQDQYVRDFRHARDLRSAANFACHGPVNGTCGETSRVRKAVGPELTDNLRCAACPYRAAKDDFVASRLGVTNYSYFLSESTYAGEIPPRRLLVCDEAHNLEDEVRRWATVEVTEGDAKELKLALPPDHGPSATDGAIAWLGEDYRPGIQAKLGTVGRRLKRIVRGGSLGEGVVRDLANSNDRLDKRLCQVNRILDRGGEVLVSESTDRKGRRSLRFQPVDVTAMVQDAIYSKAGRVLLTSATLLDRDV